MDKFNNLEVKKVFNAYPDNISAKMLFLRQLVLETAAETDGAKSMVACYQGWFLSSFGF